MKAFRIASIRRQHEDANLVNAATAKGELKKLDRVILLRHFNGEQQ